MRGEIVRIRIVRTHMPRTGMPHRRRSVRVKPVGRVRMSPERDRKRLPPAPGIADLTRLKAGSEGPPILPASFMRRPDTMQHDPCRRRFLLTAAAAAASLPLLAGAAPAGAAAAPLPRLPLADPAAKALAYTDNAAVVKHAAFKPGSACSNCNFFKAGAGQTYGPCTLFPKHTVAAEGWCSAWAKKL